MPRGERWKHVPGYVYYSVSNLGRVKNFKNWILKPASKEGYPCVALSLNGKHKTHLVHRLVLLAFRGPCPKGHEGSHLNGRRTDSRLSNLAWETISQNHARKIKHGTFLYGEKQSGAKLTEGNVHEIVWALRRGISQRLIAARYKINQNVISGIGRRQLWTHVTAMYSGSLGRRKDWRGTRNA